MKGMIAIYELMILCTYPNNLIKLLHHLTCALDLRRRLEPSAAHAHSPATARALLSEMQVSLPDDLLRIDKYVAQSLPKAYRFVREMEEMSGFVHDCLGNALEGSATAPSEPAQMFDGFAALYDRVAKSFIGPGQLRQDGPTDAVVLDSFIRELGKGRRPGQLGP